MWLFQWRKATMLILRGNPTLPMIEEMRRVYREMAETHGKYASFTCIEVTTMPKVGDAEKAAVKRLTDETADHAIAAQWIEGSGLVAATARAIVVGLSLVNKATVRTVKDAPAAVAHVMAAGNWPWTQAELLSAIEAAKRQGS
jgi:hypothetical protein